ncbi:phage tail protein [Gluconacetobacter azotocaptans]|uniref:phage tail sheath subtilisin-like domain-containing protein n=1 Tax=Gluconacetobacter azotocaptans TaxID=142834 RepID=UPI0019571F18|nr:phage tail sheath subtilisin-like domain-containing protein [Gluconacetobacter azotocaptans]MBM9400380.1 phage tail protein [Gluconacetobacter azotocaptans]
MSDSVTFNEIPSGLNIPGSVAEIQTIRTPGTLTGMPVRNLVVGQMGSGSGVALVRYPILSAAQAAALFGVGSALALAVAAHLAARPFIQLDAMAVAPAAGATVASTTVTCAGAATQSGSVAIEVAGVRIPLVITPTMMPADMATALAAAFTPAVQAATGCTAAAVAAVVTITASEVGAHTNDIDVRVSLLASDQVPGVTLTVPDGGMAGGAGSPDLTPAFNAVSNIWYTDVATCLNDQPNLAVIAIEGARRYNAMVKRDAQFYFGFRGTYGQALALSANLNSPYLCGLPASAPRWSPWVAAAVLCAVSADSTSADPARQLRTLLLTGLDGLGPDDGDLYEDPQRNVLLGQGWSTFLVQQGGAVEIERVVTTLQVDPVSNVALTTPQDIRIPKVGSRVRYEWNSYANAVWARAKLADDGSPLANSAGVVTPKVLLNSWVAQCKLYEAQGWIENVATLGPQAVFIRNTSDRNRVDSQLPIQVIGALNVLGNVIQLEG